MKTAGLALRFVMAVSTLLAASSLASASEATSSQSGWVLVRWLAGAASAGVQAPVLATSSSTAEETAPVAWSREVAVGDTLDELLAEAGMDGPQRAEAALALGAEYDLRQLRPGHEVTVEIDAEGAPSRVALTVDEGVQIEVTFDDVLSINVVLPDREVITLAKSMVVEESVFAALEAAEVPPRFAVDLAQILSGTVDFQRDFSGGETLSLLWRQSRIDDDSVGQPEVSFAVLQLRDATYEVIWPTDGSGLASIYRDGKLVRTFNQPVEGARLSSVFGSRKHPVYGTVRMHTGVDFSAPMGTPVRATAPGRITFVGWRNGYGQVVEIAHGSDTLTRYAHLSSVPAGLSEGQVVLAGDPVGDVGATGVTSGPNLHYEVLVNGKPTDPLADVQLLAMAEDGDSSGLTRLLEARVLLKNYLASGAQKAATSL